MKTFAKAKYINPRNDILLLVITGSFLLFKGLSYKLS